MRIPGMNPRRAALMQALGAVESMPLDTPRMRHADPSMDDVPLQPSVEDILFSRNGVLPRGGNRPPLDDHITHTEMDDLASYWNDQAMRAHNMQRPVIDAVDVEFGQRPMPGSPEFYDWLMGRVG